MMHPYVIDTSLIFCITGNRNRKSKLSVLAKRFLDQDIQQSHTAGHDPQEDAEAAMKLVLLKLEKGLTFGDALLDGSIPVQLESDETCEVLSATIFNHVRHSL